MKKLTSLLLYSLYFYYGFWNCHFARSDLL